MTTTDPDKLRFSRIEHARELAKEHLGIEKTIFHGSYPHPFYGYEVFSFTDMEDTVGIQVGFTEIINPQ